MHKKNIKKEGTLLEVDDDKAWTPGHWINSQFIHRELDGFDLEVKANKRENHTNKFTVHT